MGRRDYRHRETKKPKKDAKKAPVITGLSSPPVNAEVVKKEKREEKKEEEEE